VPAANFDEGPVRCAAVRSGNGDVRPSVFQVPTTRQSAWALAPSPPPCAPSRWVFSGGKRQPSAFRTTGPPLPLDGAADHAFCCSTRPRRSLRGVWKGFVDSAAIGTANAGNAPGRQRGSSPNVHRPGFGGVVARDTFRSWVLPLLPGPEIRPWIYPGSNIRRSRAVDARTIAKLARWAAQTEVRAPPPLTPSLSTNRPSCGG